jgi:pyridoxine 5-phosphate synthase
MFSPDALQHPIFKTIGRLEVSIGHALIADALYFGLENTINLYKRELKDRNL